MQIILGFGLGIFWSLILVFFVVHDKKPKTVGTLVVDHSDYEEHIFLELQKNITEKVFDGKHIYLNVEHRNYIDG